MKKIGFYFAVMLLALSLSAVDLDLGLNFGFRTLSDSQLKNAYGSGMVFNPYLQLNIYQGFFAGLTYEGGYSKEAKLGLFQEDSTFKLSDFEFFIGYEKLFSKVAPFLKVGFGSFKIKQEISSQYVSGFSETKSALTFGAGVKYFAGENIFLQLLVNYVQLKIKPFEDEIDCGGLKLQLGGGYRFNL